MLKKITSPMKLIVLLALVLRVLGLKHGFPFIFHPDEATIVRSALAIRFYKNPGHFDWPHLYIYLNYIVYMLFAKTRALASIKPIKSYIISVVPIFWNDELIFYAITRFLTALLGAFTVIPVYLAAKRLYNDTVGWISGLVFALLPFHVWFSHYTMGDVPMTFFVAWALFFAVRIYQDKKAQNYLLAGIFIGLAASVKYNAALLSIVVPLAHLFRVFEDREEKFFDFDSLMNLVFSGVCAIVGFVAGTPFAVLDYKTFLRSDSPKGAIWQFTNVGSLEFWEHFQKFFPEMIYKVADDLGYIVLAVFFLVAVVLLVKLLLRKFSNGDYALWLLVLPAMAAFIYISGFERSRSHYYLMVYPFLAIIYGYVVNLISEKSKSSLLEFLLASIFIFPLFYFSVEKTYLFTREDTRNVLHMWAAENITPDIPVISTESSLNVVLSEHPRLYTTYDAYHTLPPGWGYMVVDLESEAPSEAFYRLTLLSNTETLASIENTTRRGPKIVIYKFTK
jgi:hypothetical protein